jgi:hypothetical protein
MPPQSVSKLTLTYLNALDEDVEQGRKKRGRTYCKSVQGEGVSSTFLLKAISPDRGSKTSKGR